MDETRDQQTVAVQDKSPYSSGAALFLNMSVLHELSVGRCPWIFELELDGCEVEFMIGEV